MSSLKEQLALIRPARTAVKCGDVTVYVRRLSKLEKLEDVAVTKDVEGEAAALFGHLADQLIKVCEDEAGVPVWTHDDREQVMRLADDVFDSLLHALYQQPQKKTAD